MRYSVKGEQDWSCGERGRASPPSPPAPDRGRAAETSLHSTVVIIIIVIINNKTRGEKNLLAKSKGRVHTKLQGGNEKPLRGRFDCLIVPSSR